MSESKTPLSINFGTAIAFVAPGFLAFVAFSYFSKTAKGWLLAAADKEQGVGVFLFVLLCSIAFGIVVSGIRAMLIDRLLHCKLLKGWSVNRPEIIWDELDESKREGLNILIEGFYRYYQFYSNSLIALLILVSARLTVATSSNWSIWLCLAIAMIMFSLLWSAHDSYRKYSDGINKLFSGGIK